MVTRGYNYKAPMYYQPKSKLRYGLPFSRRNNSFQPKVSASSMSIPKYTMAVLRPFSDKAAGAKVPDMNSMPSATTFSRTSITPKINGAGYSYTAHRFQHTLTTVSGTQSGSSDSAKSANWPVIGVSYGEGGPPDALAYGLEPYVFPDGRRTRLVQDPVIDSILSNFTSIRTVSVGVKIMCSLPALSACGFVHVACVAEDMQASQWNYPKTIGMMEKAPFYTKVPLANLINNTTVVTIPIMDEGAWRYRNSAMQPSSVGSLFLKSTAAGTGANLGTTPVQLTQSGTVITDPTTGGAIVTFGVPFVTQPVVVATVQSSNDSAVQDCTVSNVSTTGCQVSSDIDPGGSAGNGNFGGSAVSWSATGFVTPANYDLFVPDGGEQLTVQNTSMAFIPGIETSYGWGACIIALEMPSFTPLADNVTSPIEVEVIRHYEAIPNAATGSVITGSPAAAADQELLARTKGVQHNQPVINTQSTENADDDLSTTARRAIMAGLRGPAGDFISGLHPVAGLAVSGYRALST